ncbi:MAG: hypothetical protein CMF51_04765 [Legionellales bacterium]|nr:hypothetical protein [Legionellales bacterium]|tara:strand:+ start:1921 stop:2400 length:480 start_codon:yes stop_codon:yes gene_type:complete
MDSSQQLRVSIQSQTVSVIQSGRVTSVYPISSSQYGCGQYLNSFQTPLGWHEIIEKVGENAPLNTIFKGRKPVGVYCDRSRDQDDWILTRIIRLSGLEDDLNRGGCYDTFSRMIYFHGTPQEDLVGSIPSSKGCLRMKNQDLISLFDQVKLKVKVYIHV